MNRKILIIVALGAIIVGGFGIYKFSYSSAEEKNIVRIIAERGENPLRLDEVLSEEWQRVCVVDEYTNAKSEDQKQKLLGDKLGQSEFYNKDFDRGIVFVNEDRPIKAYIFGKRSHRVGDRKFVFGGLHPVTTAKSGLVNGGCLSRDDATLAFHSKSGQFYLESAR